MQESKILQNKMMWGNCLLALAVVIQTVALWNEYSWYEAFAPYGTLVTFAFLCAAFFCFVTVKEAVGDKLFWVMAGTCVVAGINIFLTGSGKGAWLTAADVVIVAYLAGKVKLTRVFVWFYCVYVGSYFYYWTFDVKGYFKGYNTNYGGLVLITGFVFAITGITAFYKRLKEQGESKGAKFLFAFGIFMFAWGYNIIAWYRARCALLGFVVFAILLLIPMKAWKNKVFYTLLTLAMTLGAIAVSLVYVWLGSINADFSIRIFYKDIISGRDAIWSDLWAAFLRSPLTGIGSSYKINVDWMNGMFEVHNGLLDILIVHGVIVFAAVCWLLIDRLLMLREKACANPVAKAATAAVFAILAASFMENFFIVPPFLLAALALIAIARSV